MDFYEMALMQTGSRWDAELPDTEETDEEESTDNEFPEDWDDEEL